MTEMPKDIVEAARAAARRSVERPYNVGTMTRATETIAAALLDERQRAEERIKSLEETQSRLRAAISWIEEPFVDERTPENELRLRIAACVSDANLALLAKETPDA